MEAASGGHTDCITELLSSGAVVDLANKVSIWDPKYCKTGSKYMRKYFIYQMMKTNGHKHAAYKHN